MPKYILAFEKIDLSYMDAQIFAFMQQIAPSIGIGTIGLDLPIIPLPIASPIRRLLDMLAEQTTIRFISYRSMTNCNHPVEVFSAAETTFDEKANFIEMQKESWENDEGKQQQQHQKLFHIIFENMNDLDGEEKIFIEAIKQDFSNATQPFNFFMYVHFEYPEFSVENEQTGETLAFHIRRDKQGLRVWNFLIRHPIGQGEQWLAAGKKRFWQSWLKPTTMIAVNVNKMFEASRRIKRSSRMN